MNEDLLYDEIQNYLNNEMKETERAAFEQRLQTDSKLQEEVDLHRMADDTLELLVADNLRAELQQLGAEEAKKPSKKEGRVVNFRRRLVSISAAASVLLLIGFFGANFQARQYNDGNLASSYYQNELLTSVRGAEDQSLLEEGMRLVTAENYQEAVTYFEQIQDQDLVAEAQYAAGHAYYNLEQYDNALSAFDNAISSNDPRFVKKAEWFSLLSGLAAGQEDTEAFRSRLDQLIADDSHDFHDSAVELNKKLNSFWRSF